MQSRIKFQELKEKLNEWLHKNDHYIRQDYIEAEQVSRIGFLLGSSKNVNRLDLRKKLEGAIEREMFKRIKIDLYLAKYWLRRSIGKSEYAESLGISVDSTLVAETIKILKSILNDRVQPPTGRVLNLVPRPQTPKQRNKVNQLMKIQRSQARRERITIIGNTFNINEVVQLRNGRILTIQQALCSIKDDRNKQLFVGVEQTGETNV